MVGTKEESGRVSWLQTGAVAAGFRCPAGRATSYAGGEADSTEQQRTFGHVADVGRGPISWPRVRIRGRSRCSRAVLRLKARRKAKNAGTEQTEECETAEAGSGEKE